MRICVVGAGSIGGVIAAGLAAAGADVRVLARGATLAAIRASGLRVEWANGTGETVVKLPASDNGAEIGEQDVVVIAVKAQSLPVAVPDIVPLLGPETAVLSTLNGVPWWFFGDSGGSGNGSGNGSGSGSGGGSRSGFGGRCAGRHLDNVDPGGRIASAIPASRVIGGTVHMSASSPEPGVVRRHSGNGLIIGEPDGGDSPRVDRLASVLHEAGFDITVSRRIREDVWYKLWGNLTVNPVSALTGATADQILDDELVRVFCESAMLEAREIGARIGCPIGQTPTDRNAVTRKLGSFRTSMLQDADAGRALELDALTGAVREIGAIVGVPTPYVDALHGLTRLSALVHGQR